MHVNEQFIVSWGLMHVLLDESSVCHPTDKLRDACEWTVYIILRSGACSGWLEFFVSPNIHTAWCMKWKREWEEHAHKRPRSLRRGSWPLNTGIVGSNPILEIRSCLSCALLCRRTHCNGPNCPPPTPKPSNPTKYLAEFSKSWVVSSRIMLRRSCNCLNLKFKCLV
jgi:hypothetical protein